ncbi:hypothetical protein GCM10027073_09780 [Streptomyces chlorus]
MPVRAPTEQQWMIMSSAARRHPVHRDSIEAAHEAIDLGSVLPRRPRTREWFVARSTPGRERAGRRSM